MIFSGLTDLFFTINGFAPFFKTGAAYPDVHSLFYLKEQLPPSTLFLVVETVLLGFALLAVVNLFFNRVSLEYRIDTIEAFTVEKFAGGGAKEPIRKVDPRGLKAGVFSKDLRLAGKKAPGRGLFLLSCPSDLASMAVIRFLEKLITDRERPVVYSGRQESGLLEKILTFEEKPEDEMKRVNQKIAGNLIILPAALPTPQRIRYALEKLRRRTRLGGAVIEDLGYCKMSKLYDDRKFISELHDVSCLMETPLFIVGPAGKGRLVEKLSSKPEISSLFSYRGEIRIGKDNEIYIVPLEKE